MNNITAVKSKTFGFTVVELLVVIVVLGILASISVVSYSGIVQNAHNASIKQAANQFHKALTIYRLQNGRYPRVQADIVPNTRSAVCLGVGYSDKNGDGVGECGDPSWYARVFPQFNEDMASLIGTPTVSDTKVPLPFETGNWTGVVFVKQEGGSDPFMVDGMPNPYFMMYMLFGADKDCGMAVVEEQGVGDSDPLPHGWPNMKTTGSKFSYSDGKTTACAVALPT